MKLLQLLFLQVINIDSRMPKLMIISLNNISGKK